jgi:hypothetical protein
MNTIEPADSTNLADVTTGVSSFEWTALRASHANVLLIGKDEEVSDVVHFLEGIVPQPVLHSPFTASMLTPDFGGSVVLRDPESLNRHDQQQLLDWLAAPDRPRQVITTCGTSLFAAVQRGTFAEALYYRLNMLTFVLGPRTEPFHS